MDFELRGSDPWYVRRSLEYDPYASKHSGGRQPKRNSAAERKRRWANARIARARVNNWPRGRS